MRLLERETSLAALREYADDARGGEGRVVLIAGEAGVGKTALVERLEAELVGDSWAWGACDGLFTPRPLGPLFDIAGRLGGDLLAACEAAAPRETLFRALLDHLTTSRGLIVLVVEDAHWADEATLDLLRFLGRRVRDARVLLVVTYRDDGLRSDGPLRVVLGELASHRSTRRVDLAPLTEAAVAELAELSPAGPAASRELYRLTGGNPFYVTELLRSAPHGGLLAPGAGLPTSARDAVLARVAGLDPEARRLVDVAALAGVRIEPALLTDVAGATPAAIDSALASGVLAQDPAGLRFRHELARQAVADAVPAHRRADIHAGLLRRLRDSGADDARLAHHAEGAGDRDAVLHHAPLAARRASDLASHREAFAQYQRAVRFATDGPATSPADLASLFDGLAREASLIDHWVEAEEAWRRALELWRAAGDRLREGDTLRLLSRAYWRLCRGPESVAAIEEALQVLATAPPGRELAWAYASRAGLHMINGNAEEAIALARTAQGIAEPLGLADVLSEALNTEGSAQAIGFTASTPEALRRALEVALAAGLEEQAGRAYANLQSVALSALRFPESESYFVEGSEYCDDHDVSTFGWCLRGGRTQVLLALDRWDEATRWGEHLLSRPAMSIINRADVLVTLGVIRARRGSADAWELLDELALATDSSGEPPRVACARLARTEAAWLAGEVDRALAEFRRAADVAADIDVYERGRLGVWARRLGVAVPDLGPVPEPYATELAGDLRGAADQWEQLGCGYAAALALLGSDDEGDLREALDILDGLGAAPAAALARRRLRAMGVRGIPAGPQTATRSHRVGLTRRQQEVLALVAAGLANAEISARLFISERTVDHHVSALLAKMGVSSRGAAAAEAVRLGLVDVATGGSPATT